MNSIRKFNSKKEITLIRKMQFILLSPEAKSKIIHDVQTAKLGKLEIKRTQRH